MIEYGSNSANKNSPKKPTSSLVNMFCAEVIDIILTKDHDDYIKLGGNKTIGLITYRLIESNRTANLQSLSYAIPLQPNSKNYPLIGEVVLIYSGLPSSKSDVKETLLMNYYLSGINIFNDSQSNNVEKNEIFLKNINHSPILPKAGDIVTEGRFQNSLRFSSDDNGNPLTIIRNGRKSENVNGDFSHEDLNNDDSIVIFSSNQKVDMKVSFNDLKSFNINQIQVNTKIKQIDTKLNTKKVDLAKVIKPLPELVKEVPKVENKVADEEELVDFPLAKNEGSVDDVALDELFIEEPHATINTQHNFKEVANNRELPKLSQPLNLTKAIKYIGDLERDIPNQIKAIMEVIAFCEGTLGLNQNNGYDTVVLNCRTISNWRSDYKLGCPYQAVHTKKGKLFQKGGHWGRYQYQKSTWVLDAVTNIAFSKRNQDLICAKTIRRRLGNILYDNLHKTMQDINGVHQVCRKLAPEWASIPNGNSTKSYYNNQHVRIYSDNVQKLYNTAYKIYQNS